MAFFEHRVFKNLFQSFSVMPANTGAVTTSSETSSTTTSDRNFRYNYLQKIGCSGQLDEKKQLETIFRDVQEKDLPKRLSQFVARFSLPLSWCLRQTVWKLLLLDGSYHHHSGSDESMGTDRAANNIVQQNRLIVMDIFKALQILELVKLGGAQFFRVNMSIDNGHPRLFALGHLVWTRQLDVDKVTERLFDL